MPKTKNTVAKGRLAVLAICIVLSAASGAWGQSTAGPAEDGETAAADIDLPREFNKLGLAPAESDPSRFRTAKGTRMSMSSNSHADIRRGDRTRLLQKV